MKMENEISSHPNASYHESSREEHRIQHDILSLRLFASHIHNKDLQCW